MIDATFALLSFFDLTKSIFGRKKMQKMIHILENCGHNFTFKYEYHFYGPYSAQLQEEVNSLVRQGYLIEDRQDDTYVYRITSKGEEFKKCLEDAELSFTINLSKLEMLSEKDSQYLEMVSTYIFLRDSGYSRESAENKALELKPHLARHIKDAMIFADKVVYN